MLKPYAAMGKPLDPTPDQVDELNRETALAAPEQAKRQGGRLELSLTSDALVVVGVDP